MLWRGHTSADDEWLQAEELTQCQEKVAEYNATARRPAGPIRRRSRLPRRRPPLAPALAPLVPPAGFRLAASTEGLAGTALVCQAVLYHWLVDGWVCGTVAARSRAARFSHVRYGSASALGSAVVPSALLDAASHGPAGQWVLLLRVRRALSVLKSHFAPACIGVYKQLYRLCERRFVRTYEF